MENKKTLTIKNNFSDKTTTLHLNIFKNKIMNGSYYNFKKIVEKGQFKYQSELCDSLDRLSGSRTFCWKVFLGMIPNNMDMV